MINIPGVTYIPLTDDEIRQIKDAMIEGTDESIEDIEKRYS